MEHDSDGDSNCNWCAWYSHQRIDNKMVWFLLFNGISTFMGYLMPKPFSLKNSGGAI